MWMMNINNTSDHQNHNNNNEDNVVNHDSNSYKVKKHVPLRYSKPNTWSSTTDITTSTTKTTYNSNITAYHHAFTPSSSTLGPNHHLGKASNEQEALVQRGSNCPSSSTSRWNPAPEQLKALEEMYRGGMRTPTATQIQHIADHLRAYGKIEGKNVFYWFQNHKARERQKRRRCEDYSHDNSELLLLDKLESSSGYILSSAFEETKNIVPSNSDSSTDHLEGHVPMHNNNRAPKTTTSALFSDQKRTLMLSSEYNQVVLLDKSTIVIQPSFTTWQTTMTTRANSPPSHEPDRGNETEEIQTLELFPVYSDEFNRIEGELQEEEEEEEPEKDTRVTITSSINTNATTTTDYYKDPNLQFFEFLPLKD